MQQEFSSKWLEGAVSELSRLPGIGRKTALRLALHILRQDPQMADALGRAIIDMRHNIRYCSTCHNISQDDVCPICASTHRDHSTVCVVENVKDVMVFENTGQFQGVYHVLGGLISPMDGVGPSMLEIDSLVDRCRKDDVKEVILALSATMDGDTTNFYIYGQLSAIGRTDLTVTQIARGVAVGNEIEYTDELTLVRSLERRLPFADTFCD